MALIFTKHTWEAGDHGSGWAIRRHILGDDTLSSEEKDILLNYPAVYVHIWNGNRQVYVGETNDILRRTEEHLAQCGSTPNHWHSQWVAAADRVSYYFSSRDMNKSMVLDLEDCLIKAFQGVNVSTRNGRQNFQGLYSNKAKRPALLEEILQVLAREFPDQLSVSLPPVPSCQLPDKLIVFDQMLDPESIQDQTKRAMDGLDEAARHLLYNYPVVYLHLWEGSNGKLHVYVGEANDLLQRTQQHLNTLNSLVPDHGPNWHSDWLRAASRGKARMVVFGHREFNKSMTMDIENRLIQYFIFLSTLGKVVLVNKRHNEQNLYDNMDQVYPIFQEIVHYLHGRISPDFLQLQDVMEQSVFMASPLMKLTDEQQKAKLDITQKVLDALSSPDKTLLVVHGSAGTGKTVLLSSLYFHLLGQKNLDQTELTTYFVINQKELIHIYQAQSQAWHLGQPGATRQNNVFGAQKLLNALKKRKVAAPDILLIDEGHLLHTRGTMGAIKGAQLSPLLSQAKVTILVFDENQFVDPSQHWQPQDSWEDLHQAFRQYLQIPNLQVMEYTLNTQMRMQCAPTTRAWLDSLRHPGNAIAPFPNPQSKQQKTGVVDGITYTAYFVTDSEGYEIGVIDQVNGLDTEIKLKPSPSCLLATYDWLYNKDTVILGHWNWRITGEHKSMDHSLWTMDPQNTVGSRHSIQGLDLEYAGVILGPSFCYNSNSRYPGISFSPKKHQGFHNSGKGAPEANRLISNELGVLLSRGIKGTYLYATNDKARKALIAAIR